VTATEDVAQPVTVSVADVDSNVTVTLSVDHGVLNVTAGPGISGNGTSTLIYEAYLQAFGAFNRAGYSAAISVILFAILLIITVLQLRFVERKVHYS